jgi:hypothetical protein
MEQSSRRHSCNTFGHSICRFTHGCHRAIVVPVASAAAANHRQLWLQVGHPTKDLGASFNNVNADVYVHSPFNHLA